MPNRIIDFRIWTKFLQDAGWIEIYSITDKDYIYLRYLTYAGSTVGVKHHKDNTFEVVDFGNP